MAPDECSKSFETILYHCGKFGYYQKRFYVIMSLMHVVCASILSYMKFLPRQTVTYKCVQDRSVNLSNIILDINETVTYNTICGNVYGNEGHLGEDWVLPEWTSTLFDRRTLAYIYYTQSAGLFLGALIGGFFSDLVGRRKILYAAYTLMCIFHLLTAISEYWVFFVVVQTLVGLTAGCFIVISLPLLLEYLGHNWRDVCICLFPWWVGPSLLALEAYMTKHWRYLALASGSVGMPLIGTFFLVLESSRWLMCHHRFSEAEQATKELISCNEHAVENVITLCDIARACILNTMHKKRYSYLDLFHSRPMARWTIVVIFTWLLGSITYTGLHRRVVQMTDNPYMGCVVLYIFDVPIVLSAILINKCVGRRWCLFLFAVSSGFVAFCILILHVTNELVVAPSMVTALAFFTKLGVTSSLALICLVTLEIYPTVIRTMGCAVGFMSGIAGFVISNELVFLESFHYTIPFLVFGCLMIVVGFLSLLFPETIREPLPDILPCRHRNLCSHEAMRLMNGC